MTARKPLNIFFAVQKALFLRELSMRFSMSKTGIFWTFFEPFMQVFIMVLIKVLLFGKSNANLDFTAFLALNFTAFNMFRNILSKSMGAFAGNKALFVYKQVKPIDTIISRVMVEVFMTSIIIIAFIILGSYFGNDLDVKNLPMVVVGFLWLIVFSFSFGLFVAVVDTFYSSVGKTINIIMSLAMFFSAIFYTVDMLPIEAQSIILYNPLTHFMEMIHGSYFYALDDKYVNYDYIMLWTITLLYAGLWFYKRLEERIISL